ncbi:MAG: ribonuclease P protein component [Gammaproteobacteria bacterium]|nr:ribonuclease P protein component [Gammaproteobacteria bacterium]
MEPAVVATRRGCLQISLTFSRQLRLLDTPRYDAVFNQGVRFHSRDLLLFCLPNGLNHPRLGLGVSKRWLKRACQRNLVKRQLREGFRLNQQLIGGYDLVIVTKRGVIADKQLIQESLKKLWKKIPPLQAPA